MQTDAGGMQLVAYHALVTKRLTDLVQSGGLTKRRILHNYTHALIHISTEVYSSLGFLYTRKWRDITTTKYISAACSLSVHTVLCRMF